MRTVLMENNSQLCLMTRKAKFPLHTQDKDLLEKELDIIDVSHSQLANIFRNKAVLKLDSSKAEKLIRFMGQR